MSISLYLLPIFFLFMIGDVIGRNKNNLKLVSICQPGTTIVVLIMAGLSLLTEHFHLSYSLAIMGGLLVSVIADTLLVSRTDKTGFVKGMGLFLVTILTYGITWTVLNGFQKSNWTITIIMAIVYIILVVLFFKLKEKPSPSKIVLIGVVIYLLAFCFTISRAVSTFDGTFFSATQSILMTIGIISFFLGDMQLGIYHFISPKFPMEQAPPFYFVGQLLIALSCSYF